MGFTLIKGTFHVVGYSPDGDSIRFQADKASNWELLDGPAVQRNARDHAQLRIEAIDTLETHFEGHHQPLKFAKAALEYLLDQVGITDVSFDAAGTKVESAKDGTRGYILARKVEHYHRPVSFVFAGDAPEEDGDSVFLKSDRLETSVNYRLIQAGLAYPTYYTGLFSDLRKTITAAAVKARAEKKGLWPADRTNAGFEVKTIVAVTEDTVILPKLFRRITTFMGTGGGISGFKAFLQKNPDPVMALKDGHFTHLDTFIDVSGKNVTMTVKPEELVFVEK